MDVRMSFCTLTLRIFVFGPRSTPSQKSLNRVIEASSRRNIAWNTGTLPQEHCQTLTLNLGTDRTKLIRTRDCQLFSYYLHSPYSLFQSLFSHYLHFLQTRTSRLSSWFCNISYLSQYLEKTPGLHNLIYKYKKQVQNTLKFIYQITPLNCLFILILPCWA